VRALAGNKGLAPRWAVFESARAAAARGLAAELLPAAMSGEVPFAGLAPAFRRAFLQKWLGEAVQAREPLKTFATLTHEQRVAECGFGVRLPTYEFGDGQLHEAIDRLLAGPAPRLDEASARLRAQPGTVRAADLIQSLA
jgi:hypothetical protein